LDRNELWEMEGKESLLFLAILIRAEKKGFEDIKKGQVVASLADLCKWTSLTSRNVRTCLAKLEKMKKIKRENIKKFTTKITVVEYENYVDFTYRQRSDKASDKASDKVSDKASDKASAFVINNNTDKYSILKNKTDKASDKVSDKASDKANDKEATKQSHLNPFLEGGDKASDKEAVFANIPGISDYDMSKKETDKVSDKANDNEPTLFPEKREKKENDTKEKKEKNISKEKETISINRDSKEKEKSAKETENGIKPPDPFDILVDEWIAYRRRIKKTIKTERGLEWIKSRLKNLSKGDPEIARKIIDQSMDHEWQGLFELKNESNDRKRETRQDLLHNIPTTFVGSSTI